MFESLSEKLSGILDRLTGRGALSEDDVAAAMREVRRALLEADVALEVVRSFIDRARTKAVGAAVRQVGQARPDGRQDRPRRAGRDARRPSRADRPQRSGSPVAIMMVGLQGAGKTTTAAKIAKRLTEREQAPRADGLARREAPGRAGAARDPRPAGRRRHACRSSRARRRSTSPDAPMEAARLRGLRRRHPRHRRPHPYRRAADAGDGGHQATPARTKSCSSPTR